MQSIDPEDLSVLDTPGGNPPPDWTETGDSDHFVQFYENEAFLLNSLAGFIGTGFRRGDAGIVIATDEHRRGLQTRLEAEGIDIAGAVASGQFTALDARETLSKFMVDGAPDAGLFAQTIGPVLVRAARSGKRVRAFGELVALLWAEGNHTGVVRLEELWNDLAKSHSFALFCAYPIQGFSENSHGSTFGDICCHHSRVIPSESYAALKTRDEQLRAITLLQQKAAALQAEVGARQAAEYSLRLRERELADFLENAAEGLHRVGPDGKILWANKAELELLGYAADEYIGQHVTRFHADRKAGQEMLDRLLRGETLYNHQAKLRAKDGSVRHVLIHSNALWEDKKFVYTRCFTRDITDQKRLQDEREAILTSERTARLEAERANRMKDEFVATLSHELRTPLTAILGWSQLLRKGSVEPHELDSALETIERNARAQTQMIEELLDISRIAAGKLRLNVQCVDLAEVLGDAVNSVRPAADARGIRLQTMVDPQDYLVSGDPTRLQQIIWNLLSNAVKFTDKGGHVRVVLQRVNSHVEITVSDNGKGIKPAFLPHVFSRFRQEDASTTRQYGGLGLGLAIVKNLVEMHGGTVRAASEGEGKGATFSFELPLLAVEPGNTGPGAAKPLPQPRARAGGDDTAGPALRDVKILVVDDDPESCKVIGRQLEDCGAVVKTVASAFEAMEVFLSFRPDILLSDIGMPEMDGYDLARWVRSLHPDHGGQTPAAALTALAKSEDRTRALLAGYQVHISKPIESAELIAAATSLASVSGC